MIRPISFTIGILFAAFAFALGEMEPLNHYGVAAIGNPQVEEAFSARFNAQGKPVFLIGDLRRGVAIGDIIRFRNKVILIDDQVWQTMKTTGVLDDIRTAPVVELSAQSNSGVWKSRSDLAEGREKIAYTLGAEFITILEDYFGTIPRNMEIAFNFEGNKMTILAPAEMLGLLKFIQKPGKEKDTSPPKSQPFIVSDPPKRAFLGEPFSWMVWAVDRGVPSEELAYAVETELPPGLHWDAAHHAISGKPIKAGAWKIKVRASNASKRGDDLTFNLPVAADAKPKIWGEPSRETDADGVWRFQPGISDPDHLLSELRIEPHALPSGMNFDKATNTFTCNGQDIARLGHAAFGLKVTDPLGASVERTFELGSTTAMHFRSALNSGYLQQGQSSYYTPVATGPGRTIHYEAHDGGNRQVPMAEDRIPLATDRPGDFAYEILAEDELGNRSSQIIAFQVHPQETLRQTVVMEMRQRSAALNTNAYYRLGRSRLGLMLPETHFKFAPPALPFLFAGFQPLPVQVLGEGNSLYLDMGMSLQGNSGVTYGGFLLRMDGQHHQLRKDPFVFKYGAQYYARQGILLFNPRDFQRNDLGSDKVDSCLRDLRSTSDRPDSLIAGALRCNDGLNRMADAYSSGTNEVLFLEMQLWMNLGHAIGLGPVYWLEDHFHTGQAFEQRIGLGLAQEGSYPWFGYSASLKAGFTNSQPIAKILFDLSLHFERPNR